MAPPAAGNRQEVFVSGYQQVDGRNVPVTVRLIVEDYSGVILQAQIIPLKQSGDSRHKEPV